MKNDAEIIWWKTVKQDVETTPTRFTSTAARLSHSRQYFLNFLEELQPAIIFLLHTTLTASTPYQNPGIRPSV